MIVCVCVFMCVCVMPNPFNNFILFSNTQHLSTGLLALQQCLDNAWLTSATYLPLSTTARLHTVPVCLPYGAPQPHSSCPIPSTGAPTGESACTEVE